MTIAVGVLRVALSLSAIGLLAPVTVAEADAQDVPSARANRMPLAIPLAQPAVAELDLGHQLTATKDANGRPADTGAVRTQSPHEPQRRSFVPRSTAYEPSSLALTVHLEAPASQGGSNSSPLAQAAVEPGECVIEIPVGVIGFEGELATAPFEGTAKCTKPTAQSGQAVLRTAGGSLVASGNAYSETTTSAVSKGVGSRIPQGNYVIVYEVILISPTGAWGPIPPQCAVNGAELRCTLTLPFQVRSPFIAHRETRGSRNPGSKLKFPCKGDPVNCATGNLTETETDFSVGGRGPGLRMVRSYNSLVAAEAQEAGPFGYGWTGTYTAHLELNPSLETATVVQDNGSAVVFIPEAATGVYTPAAWIQATLKKEGTNYLYTLADQTKLEFNSEGRLIRELDRNGNAIAFAYNPSTKQLETATDGAGRKLTFKYNASGQIESITDPLGFIVRYAYVSGQLTSVTLPGRETARWQYEYAGPHLLTTLSDGGGKAIKTAYNSSNLVQSQTDQMERKREFTYANAEFNPETTIKEPNGSQTIEKFNFDELPTELWVPTFEPVPTGYEYDSSENLIAVTDPGNHTTKYKYNSAGDKIGETDPAGHETKWEYDSTHDVTSTTTPRGEMTTITRDAHGNAVEVSRLAPNNQRQITKDAYDSNGDLESVTDPLERTSRYGYDAYGDRTSEIDPEGGKRTWAYDEDSRETSTTSPRGNAPGADASRYTTTFERDAQGRPLSVSEPPASYSMQATFSRSFGSPVFGSAPLQAFTMDKSGDVFITEDPPVSAAVQEFNEQGTLIRQFGTGTLPKPCTGALRAANGIAVDLEGNVWVSDTLNNRVVEFGPEGTCKLQVGETAGAGQLKEPRGIAVAPNGSVWVVDNGNRRVAEFGKSGEYLGQVGSALVFFYPTRITVDSKGHIWVTDLLANHVLEFAEKGELIREFGSEGAGIGQFDWAAGVAVDPSGHVFVADWHNARVEEFNEQGEFLAQFGREGTGQSQMHWPAEVYLGSGGLWVSEDWQGRIERWAPFIPTTKYTYDANGNLESVTNPDGHKTTYTYDADNELTKLTEPNGTTQETEYDSAGQVVAQIDGNHHKTSYVRNPLEEVAEVIDPLGRKTIKEYWLWGGLWKVTDPEGRTTTYSYDPDNRLANVTYSDGKTHSVENEYDADGNRTKMIDGTGATTYTYDQLDRLTESRDGHGEAVAYGYDLADELTKLTYPNGKIVERSYDRAGRLASVTDWQGNTTRFSYDPDSDLSTTTFPALTGEVDHYTYDEADRMSGVAIGGGKWGGTPASLSYARDAEGNVIKTLSSGLSGEASTQDEYDEDGRLTKAGAATNEYDGAGNPTKIGTGSYKYNNANELETGLSLTYTYNAMGQRTKTTPSTGPATSYAYDEAGNLISVERPSEGVVAKIEDSYTYSGEGLRASQTISGTTGYLAWDVSAQLPLLLNDGTNSYLYGPGGLPVEQINNSTGTVQYLHHDQQGSTVLVTGSIGGVAGKCSYGPYGTRTCEGTATSPLGYDAQYTNSDTGLIYLRSRIYDPGTAQFLSVDPLVSVTGSPYTYAEDNPLNGADPAGLFSLSDVVSIGSTVVTGAICVATVGGGCAAAIAGNAAIQSALVLAGSGSTEEKIGLVLSTALLAQGAGLASGIDAAIEDLAAESNVPGYIKGYLKSIGAVLPGLPALLQPLSSRC